MSEEEADLRQTAIARAVVQSGEGWFSTTHHAGRTWLRLCLVNLYTEKSDIETLVRKIWFRYYSNSPFDRGFARLFPPERSANGRRSLAYVAERVRREEIIRATS